MKEYRLKIALDRETIFIHEPSYLKAKKMVDTYPIAFEHCVRMMNKWSAKIREYGLTEEREKKFCSWENIMDKALSGKPSEFFKKLNNLKLL